MTAKDKSIIIVAKTDRLLIRQFHDTDLEKMSKVLGDPAVMRFSLSGTKSREETRQFIEKCREIYQACDFGIWAVERREDQELLGYCGLILQTVEEERFMELGYRLGVSYWGKGYATEAAEIVQDYALFRLKLPYLISIIEPENIASWRVAEKIGMFHERDSTFGGKAVRIYSRGRK